MADPWRENQQTGILTKTQLKLKRRLYIETSNIFWCV